MEFDSGVNRDVYNSLAVEYESRVEDLMPVTEAAMDYFAQYIKPEGSVLDVGCAVGIAMSVLRGKGFEVSGIDISDQQAAFAKLRNPESEVVVGDFLETDFQRQFDAILAFAFIHLFPKEQVKSVIHKIKDTLTLGGVTLLSTTESLESKEGWFPKSDYDKQEVRYRSFWTEDELRSVICDSGLEIIALQRFTDPFGKTWMDFVAKSND